MQTTRGSQNSDSAQSLVDEFKQLIKCEQCIETKNYYFERHECGGQSVKVTLTHLLARDEEKDVIRFGKCDHCNKLFYYVDYKSTIM